MLSLRARLTLSYAFLIFLVLTLVAAFAGRYLLNVQLRQIEDAMEVEASIIRTIIVEHPKADHDRLTHLITDRGVNPNAIVRIYPTDPPDMRRVSPWPFVLGMRRIRLSAFSGDIDVIANYEIVNPVVTRFGLFFGLTVLAILVFSWWCARLVAREAIRPLIRVTEELRRFARGDFTPRAVTKIDSDEFGELTVAYNAAAVQVSAAFEEHILVEEQMKRFVADASHELRTPLTVISGYLDILKKMDPTDLAGHDRAFRTLNVETRRVRLLVDRLVALARLERSEPAQREVLDLRTVTNDVILEVGVARNVTIDLEIQDDCSIVADLADVYDAIRNLVENAVKYGEGAPVCVRLSRAVDYGRVHVLDGGPGIPENERPHLYERFFRGERRTNIEGSGLGLSIVARAMQRSNGSVTLASGEPGCTEFQLCFPLYLAA